MIDSQTYFWVFSTIIQAFAALVALIGMFVVFRLQIIKSEIESSYRDLSAFFRKNLSKDQLESHIDYDIIKFEKEIEKRQEEIEEGPTQGRRIQLKAQIEDFEEEIEDRRRRINLIYSHKSESEAIIKKSKPIFYHNAFLISLSIIVLPLKNFLGDSGQIIVIGVGTILALIVLISTFQNMLKIIGSSVYN